MKIIRSIYLIINYKTFLVTILSVASTYLCSRYGIMADFPLNIVGVAIVFPVVFSIDSAYKRRERSLALLADFKAHMLSLFQASRDWITPENPEFQEKLKGQLVSAHSALRDMLSSGKGKEAAAEQAMYSQLSNLSKMLQEFRALGLVAGEVSRVSQYISKLTVSMENLKAIFNYRTPVTLRAYSKVFIYSFPVLYGPYFVFASQNYSTNLEYMMPIVFSFIFVSLDNIQSHLENPYDQVGEDDIKFDVEEFSENLK